MPCVQPGHVDLLGVDQRGLVLAAAVMVEEWDEMDMSRQVGIERQCLPDQPAAAFPVSRQRQAGAQIGEDVRVERIECDRALGLVVECRQIATVIMRDRQIHPAVLTRGVDGDGPLGRAPLPFERLGTGIVPELVFLRVQVAEARPPVRVVRLPLERLFETIAQPRVLLRA